MTHMYSTIGRVMTQPYLQTFRESEFNDPLYRGAAADMLIRAVIE